MQKLAREQWKKLKAEAQAGYSDAQWQVGSWLQDGLADPSGLVLVHPDARAAVRWFRRSATAGNSAGQIHLGTCLSARHGVRRDDSDALYWYKRALRQGNFCALNNIACVYRDRGDNRRAQSWYRRAAASGDGDALVEVGRGYSRGAGVRRDPKRAVQCFRKAITCKSITQAGRENAMFQLGVAYYEGRGVKKSIALAIKWLSRANKDDDHDDARDLMERLDKGFDE